MDTIHKRTNRNQDIYERNINAIERIHNSSVNKSPVPTKEEWLRQRQARELMLDIESKHQVHKRCIIGCISAAIVFVLYALLALLTEINIYCLTAAMAAACVVIVVCLLYFNAPCACESKPTPRVRRR